MKTTNAKSETKNRKIKMIKTISLLTTLGILSTSPQLSAETNQKGAFDGQLSHQRSYQNIGYWCRDRLRVLRQYQEQAKMYYSYGQSSTALNTLEIGLTKAFQQTDPYYMGALTAKAIQRGITLVSALKNSVSGSPSGTKTVVHFLFEYFDFIEKVANQIDIPYYAPYQNCNYCQRSNDMQFEQSFIKYSKMQIQMVLKTMTFLGSNGLEIFPLGTPVGFLKALELTSTYAAQDLEQSLFYTRYACTIQDLYSLSNQLASFNGGNMSYPNEVIAVNSSYFQAQDIIQNNYGCHSIYPSNSMIGNTEVLANSNFILSSGTTETLPLYENRYIKNIIVSAEGVRNDSKFQVMVNGEIKGTIYVPGKDPSYIVTINDQTGSIEFMSEFGDARILKVIVNYQN